MRRFDYNRLSEMAVPMRVMQMIARIHELKGRQDLHKEQRPQLLDTLRQVAVIQSTESSNRIENIVVDPARLREIMAERSQPRNRPENEIAGYRSLLDTIHTSAAYIPVRPGVIQQLHRDLYRFSPGEGGVWKRKDNEIEEIMPDGTRFVRFRAVPAIQTAEAMEQLCQEFNRAWDKKIADELVLLASFVLDFLCIHPFDDGNGRMARLLTLLILYHGGFEVGRFISLERIVEQSKETYYSTLYQSSQGWHENEHELMPWLEYILGVILAAYKEFEGRVNTVEESPGYKSGFVRDVILKIHQPFTMQDLQHACPGIGLPTIRKVLNAMRAEGLILCIERGRNARWVRT